MKLNLHIKQFYLPLFLTVGLLFGASSLFGQKFGYVDTEHILTKIPEYKAAQKEIDKISIDYQVQIEKMYKSLDSMRYTYKQEEILLTDEMKKKRIKEIDEKEGEVKEFQKKIFGFEGRIFLKRQELIKPIQDMVYTAVEEVAKDHKLQIVFDKASDVVMIYTNPTHDYTDYVLEVLELGDPKDVIDNKR